MAGICAGAISNYKAASASHITALQGTYGDGLAEPWYD